MLKQVQHDGSFFCDVGKLRNGLTFFIELAPYIVKVEK